MNYEKKNRSFSRKKLYNNNQDSLISVNYDQSVIKQIIQHREPFLFIDSIKAIDLKNKTIVGARKIDESDPVFKGHFPDNPVYPGVLQIEMVGQLGLCLHHFLANKTILFGPGSKTVNIRLIKLHHALFLNEILPGDNVEITCQEIESDDFIVKGIGQIIKNNIICTVLSAESYIL